MAMARHGLMGLLLLASACTAQTSTQSSTGSNEASAPAPAQASNRCDASAAQNLVGQAYSDALAENARQATGARTIRRIEPGQAVTMDFREDRLNIELDEQGKVARVRCG